MLEGYTSTFPRAEFWKALKDGRFDLPRCMTCDEWQAPGAAKCARCGSERLAWTTASGRGEVYSLLERLGAPGSDTRFIVVVTLAEGPVVMGSMDGGAVGVEVGMPVQALIPSGASVDGLVSFVASGN